MDAKLLATIIAIAKKESQGYLSDFSKLDSKVDSQLKALEVKLEGQLRALHKVDPITETPGFVLHNGCLHCTWPSGRSSNLGPVLGKDGKDGKDGATGKDGIKGKDGLDGKDGAAAAAGRDGVAGKQGLTGAVGPRGEPGQDGKQGVPGKAGKDAERGAQGLPGLDGYDGEDGVGISKVWIDDNYHLTIQLTSGIVLDVGYTRGKTGASSSKGGRVTGYTGGGGTGGNNTSLSISSAAYVDGSLILTRYDGTTIDTGPFPISTTLTWIDYVQNWKVVPSQIGTTADGSVFSYEYTTSTFYRLVPNGTTLLLDSFYTSWDAATSVLDGFILDRSMNV